MADFVKVGNIVSPNGASVIFGAESTQDHRDIEILNSDTYLPYDIVIVEEDTDETIPANQVTFNPSSNSILTSDNVQSAINELTLAVYATARGFTQEVCVLTEGAISRTLSGTFSPESMMVFYNGLLINNTIHFLLVGKTIQFLDFAAEEGDILTVIGFSSSGESVDVNAASLIGGSY